MFTFRLRTIEPRHLAATNGFVWLVFPLWMDKNSPATSIISILNLATWPLGVNHTVTTIILIKTEQICMNSIIDTPGTFLSVTKLFGVVNLRSTTLLLFNLHELPPPPPDKSWFRMFMIVIIDTILKILITNKKKWKGACKRYLSYKSLIL